MAASRPTSPIVAYQLTSLEGFVCGGIAGCGAVTFTNPMEVCKTRLQLDGELQKTVKTASGQTTGKVYNGVWDVVRKTYKGEGIRGLQRGLGAAYVYQVMLNGARLGFYDPIRRVANKALGYSPTEQVIPLNVFAGASSGVIGASLGNPLYLVKARLQAYSPVSPVGAQYNYRSFVHALASIVKVEGPKGLLRGVDAAILRTAMGSSVQLPSYNLAKGYLTSSGLLPEPGFLQFLASSSFAGLCVLTVMQPADTALTRMYNQSPNSAAADKNPIDCLWKTYKAEGVSGWYKGSLSHFYRIVPHTTLSLIFNEYVTRQYSNFQTTRLQAENAK